jgi:hypothetical protein
VKCLLYAQVLNTGSQASGTISGSSGNYWSWSLAGGSRSLDASPWKHLVPGPFLSLLPVHNDVKKLLHTLPLPCSSSSSWTQNQQSQGLRTETSKTTCSAQVALVYCVNHCPLQHFNISPFRADIGWSYLYTCPGFSTEPDLDTAYKCRVKWMGYSRTSRCPFPTQDINTPNYFHNFNVSKVHADGSDSKASCPASCLLRWTMLTALSTPALLSHLLHLFGFSPGCSGFVYVAIN